MFAQPAKKMLHDPFDRAFTIMVGVSAAAHIFFFFLFFGLSSILGAPEPKQEIVRIEMLVKELPKGPKIGTQAPTKTQTAARAPDHRKASQIKKEKNADMALKKKGRKIVSKRLNYKERQRQSAIDKIKQLRNTREGGGGTGNKSGGNVFSIYLAQVKRRIENAWNLPPGLSYEDKNKKVYCRLKIGAGGRINSYYVSRSSGLPHLDRSALAAIGAVGSLPNPPPLIAKELEAKGMTIVFDPKRK